MEHLGKVERCSPTSATGEMDSEMDRRTEWPLLTFSWVSRYRREFRYTVHYREEMIRSAVTASKMPPALAKMEGARSFFSGIGLCSDRNRP